MPSVPTPPNVLSNATATRITQKALIVRARSPISQVCGLTCGPPHPLRAIRRHLVRLCQLPGDVALHQLRDPRGVVTLPEQHGQLGQRRLDPLGDYLGALEETIALDARLALPGHGDPIEDPAARARGLIEHHRERLAATAAALGDEPLSGYEVSYPLFGDDLKPSARRFAVAETLSHLERLVLEGGATRHEGVGSVTYTSA